MLCYKPALTARPVCRAYPECDSYTNSPGHQVRRTSNAAVTSARPGVGGGLCAATKSDKARRQLQSHEKERSGRVETGLVDPAMVGENIMDNAVARLNKNLGTDAPINSYPAALFHPF